MRAGFARSVITPRPGAYLAGFGARQERAQGVHDDLYARALVLEEASQQIAVVVCDLCEMDRSFVAEVRRRVQDVVGIPPDRVMLVAAHTHAAPATFALYSLPPAPGWLDDLADRVTDAVASAAQDLAPATLALALGREDSVARNRRRPDGPVDLTVTVLRAERTGAPPPFLLHYACHPTVLGPDNLMISRDYIGFAVDAVETATGGRVLFANGACGDVNVGHSADRSALGLPIPGRTFARAEELGLNLASEAYRALAQGRPVERLAGADAPLRRKEGGLLAEARRHVAVPLRSGPSPEEAADEVKNCRQRLEALESACAATEAVYAARLDLLYAQLGQDWARQYAGRAGAGASETVEVQAFAVGDVALIGLPGEFFAESGLRLRARSPFPHTVVIGYANGGIGYVPPASAFAEGGYETRLAPWSRVAPEAEGLIQYAAVSLLDTLYERARSGPGIGQDGWTG